MHVHPDSEGWFPDPFGRYEYRWFDGARWTATVGLHGEQHIEVTDARGEAVLRLNRPAKLLKSTVVVESADGHEIGRLVQQNVIGKVRFAMLAAGGARVGMLLAENWRAWDFRIEDVEGREVARIRKTFEGLARALFTTADNYVVRVPEPLPDPLRSLTVAAALCVDTALKQDEPRSSTPL